MQNANASDADAHQEIEVRQSNDAEQRKAVLYIILVIKHIND